MPDSDSDSSEGEYVCTGDPGNGNNEGGKGENTCLDADTRILRCHLLILHVTLGVQVLSQVHVVLVRRRKGTLWLMQDVAVHHTLSGIGNCVPLHIRSRRLECCHHRLFPLMGFVFASHQVQERCLGKN